MLGDDGRGCHPASVKNVCATRALDTRSKGARPCQSTQRFGPVIFTSASSRSAAIMNLSMRTIAFLPDLNHATIVIGRTAHAAASD